MNLALPDWASPETRASLARDYAVYIGRILLADDGAAGWDWDLNRRLRAHETQLVREIAAALPRGRAWTPHSVASATCTALDLHGAHLAVAKRLRDKNIPNEQSENRPAPAADSS